MTDWITSELPRAAASLRQPFVAKFEKRSRAEEVWTRFEAEFESVFRTFHHLYGWRWDFALQLQRYVEAMAADAAGRRKRHRRRIDSIPATWLHDPVTTWAQTYVDRYTGTFRRLPGAVSHLRRLGITHLHLMPPYLTPAANDGGYAVSDYRRTDPRLGTMVELEAAIDSLAEAGIGVCLDVVLNHTAADHTWATAAIAGDPTYRAFYHTFDDRTVPDRYAAHLRSIFPDRDGDAFTWQPSIGAWVWTTFHDYQWDLDYRNPEVLTAMAGEMGFLANLGVAALRLDATPFIWKREGTTCENLPEAHQVIELLASYLRVVAPGVQLLSEAIVHPDDVARYVRPSEARLGYNPLLMATMWEAFATGQTTLLRDALAVRSHLPPGCQWLTYLRCHDDIGWGFADEDARRLGIDPDGHRRFLNAFYSGEFPGSFARGSVFQHNPETGDARISGTLASLAGLRRAVESADADEIALAVNRIEALFTLMFTTVGIPLLYLGDEYGQGDDTTYLEDPLVAQDNRWSHRPTFDWRAFERASAGEGAGATILATVECLARRRAESPAFRSPAPQILEAGHPAVIAFRRSAGGRTVTVVVNVSGEPAQTALSPTGTEWRDRVDPPGPVMLGPYGARVWEASDIAPGLVG